MDFFKHIFVTILFFMGFIGVQSTRREKMHQKTPQIIFFQRSHKSNDYNPHLKQASGRSTAFSTESGNCIHHLCSNVTNYPSGYIRSVINKKKEFHRFFGSVIQPYHLPTLEGKSPKAKESDDKNMCETVQFTYYPETAFNKYNKRMMIVNVDKFRQAVSFETCIPKAKCFLSDHKPLGYETSCKQQYNLIRLVSISEDGNLTLDSFPVPSSCVCTYRRIVGYD